MKWEPLETAPVDGPEVYVKLDDGTITKAMRVSPPPIEIDPDQTFGGWMVEVSGRDDLDYEIVGWAYKVENEQPK